MRVRKGTPDGGIHQRKAFQEEGRAGVMVLRSEHGAQAEYSTAQYTWRLAGGSRARH